MTLEKHLNTLISKALDQKHNLTKTIIHNGEHLINIVDKLMNPEDNGFKLLKLKDIDENIIGNHEVWTESPCLMIKADQKILTML